MELTETKIVTTKVELKRIPGSNFAITRKSVVTNDNGHETTEYSYFIVDYDEYMTGRFVDYDEDKEPYKRYYYVKAPEDMQLFYDFYNESDRRSRMFEEHEELLADLWNRDGIGFDVTYAYYPRWTDHIIFKADGSVLSTKVHNTFLKRDWKTNKLEAYLREQPWVDQESIHRSYVPGNGDGLEVDFCFSDEFMTDIVEYKDRMREEKGYGILSDILFYGCKRHGDHLGIAQFMKDEDDD